MTPSSVDFSYISFLSFLISTVCKCHSKFCMGPALNSVPALESGLMYIFESCIAEMRTPCI